jgi:hypothetical protein
VSAETGISHLDQVSVELLLILAFFVTPSKYDGLLQRIECKGRTSQSILPKSQFLHVKVGKDEPSSVSTFGRPNWGANSASTFIQTMPDNGIGYI